MGKVVGRFFDADGEPTALRTTAEAQAAAVREAKAENKAAYAGQPQAQPCNVRWNKKDGGWVYCMEQEEGQQRYPRRVISPDDSGALHERCACFAEQEHGTARRLYDSCQPDATKCMTSAPEEPEWAE